MKEKITTITAVQFFNLLEEKQGNLKNAKNLCIKGKVVFKQNYPYPILLGEITFLNEVCFGKASFLKSFHCGRARFQATVRFNQAIFKKGMHYAKATFEEKVLYGCSTWEGESDYGDAIFHRDINYENAHLQAKDILLIGSCTFKGKKICRNRPDLASKFLMKEFKIFN